MPCASGWGSGLWFDLATMLFVLTRSAHWDKRLRTELKACPASLKYANVPRLEASPQASSKMALRQTPTHAASRSQSNTPKDEADPVARMKRKRNAGFWGVTQRGG